MNYLVHLHLSDPDTDCQLGTMMGDFVKGPLDPALPPGFRRGIVLHRRVDSYAQGDPAFRRSKRRLDDVFGHCKGIMIDVFYDHFLARHWDLYSPIFLEDFASQIYAQLERNFSCLPPGLQRLTPHMIGENWLVSYREINTIGRVLERLSSRLHRPNRLADALPELHRHYAALEDDFFAFIPAAAAHLQAFPKGE
jgi:acyl carrier protein phosphodiesterase